jgi:hypothetical protein
MMADYDYSLLPLSCLLFQFNTEEIDRDNYIDQLTVPNVAECEDFAMNDRTGKIRTLFLCDVINNSSVSVEPSTWSFEV